MKEIIRIAGKIALLVIILFLVTRLFKKADEKAILFPEKPFYSEGNAPDSIRSAITVQLERFQEGYAKRDPGALESFMQTLFSVEDVLILGTMPREIYTGYENAAKLIRSDWESWGNCIFNTENANISSAGNTAWFSTQGLVKFDMSKHLVIPLRLTGVMVKEGDNWKFRHLQFQFDIDFSFALFATLLLAGWIMVSVAILIVKVLKNITVRETTSTGDDMQV